MRKLSSSDAAGFTPLSKWEYVFGSHVQTKLNATTPSCKVQRDLFGAVNPSHFKFMDENSTNFVRCDSNCMAMMNHGSCHISRQFIKDSVTAAFHQIYCLILSKEFALICQALHVIDKCFVGSNGSREIHPGQRMR